MKKKLKLSFAILYLSLLTHIAFSQQASEMDKFSGAWEFVKPPLKDAVVQQPFLTTLKVFDKEGSCLQLKVTDKGTVVWQKAKIELKADQFLIETINYSINPSLNNTSLTIKYKFLSDQSGNQFLVIQGGYKLIDGKETFDWAELWRKVETIKQN